MKFLKSRSGRLGAATALSTLLIACANSEPPAAVSAAPSASPSASAGTAEMPGDAACAAMRQTPTALLPNPATVIELASYVPARAADAKSAALPAHCLLRGHIARRTGVDGQRYQISFELRLPTNWNHRFFLVGGGGTNGVLLPAYGIPGPNRTDSALSRGFAVVSTDGGHDNAVDKRADAFGLLSFGMDPQARLDQSYNAYDQVTRLGKALVLRYYGNRPEHSYMVGCSEGGREAMVFTQRYPDAYDGVVAADPGFHIATVSAAGAWTSKAFAAIATQRDANGAPLINKTFTDHDLLLVRNAVLQRCDALDGAKDGLVLDTAACQKVFDPMSARLPSGQPLQCTRDGQADCLTHAQLAALKLAFEAPKNSQGRELYPSWPWDAGVSGTADGAYNQGWRRWWLGAYSSPANTAARLNGWSAQSALVDWATPPAPMPLSQVAARTLAFDFDIDPARIDAVDARFTVATSQAHVADATDLRAFAARGGHMILYHGVSDAAFSANDTIRWYEAMSTQMKSRGADVARLYLVPGMNHCSGGPATDSFDMLSPLVDWVEHGRAPRAIEAHASKPAYFGVASLSRPLCPYPQVARYRGTGDMNDAASFSCSAP